MAILENSIIKDYWDIYHRILEERISKLKIAHADLSGVDLTDAHLTEANLTLSLLGDIRTFANTKIEKIGFKKTLTNASEFINYFKKYGNLITVKQIDKKELEEVIKEMRVDEKVKEYIRKFKLPLYLISNQGI